MVSQGPRDPTAAATVDGGNTVWINPNNALTLNTIYATADHLTNAKPTQYLQTTNYGFTIPAGATINGIVVTITRTPVNSNNTFYDKTVQLIKGGIKTGSNYAHSTDPADDWISGPQTITYGTGTTDLWGTTWSIAEINAIDFGVAFQVQSNDAVDYFPEDPSVDDMQITVYYTAGAGGNVIAWTVA
jgi:hypothetical protein